MPVLRSKIKVKSDAFAVNAQRMLEMLTEVQRLEQFHAWLRGPLRALLPHEMAICVERRAAGDLRQVDSLHHSLVDADTMRVLCRPEEGLVFRLARSFGSDRRQSGVMDSDALKALLNNDSGDSGDGGWLDRGLLQNMVIHRIKMLSGTAYFFILVNVPKDRVTRCRQLLKLLSSHLKMALSRAIATPAGMGTATLTRREIEILRWIGEGKSNREIGVILGISPITVKDHLSKIFRKLNVQNRAEAVARGLSASGAPVSGDPQPVK